MDRKAMKELIFKTNSSLAPFILRVLLAVVIFPHGAQKLFGWFGGYGFSGTMNYFTETVGMPWILGLLVILLETTGIFILIAGYATRLLAVAYTFLAFGIMFSSHLQFGFFMNWYGNQAGEGIEYFLLWLGISISLIISGAGKYSLDRSISEPEKLSFKHQF